MNKSEMERLLRALDEHAAEAGPPAPADLADAEHAALDDLLSMQALMRAAVAESAPEAARPFLADRVMRHLAAPRRQVKAWAQEELSARLEWLFRRVALACLLVIIGLATYNVRAVAGFDDLTAAEAVFGLPPVSLAAADVLDY